MKKIFLLILIIITFYSVNSISKYSGMLEYNFLSVNIVLVENTYNSSTHKMISNYSKQKNNKYNNHVTSSYSLDINSDVFIDTNTNIQIQVQK